LQDENKKILDEFGREIKTDKVNRYFNPKFNKPFPKFANEKLAFLKDKWGKIKKENLLKKKILKVGLHKVKKAAMEDKNSAAALVSVIKKIVIESEAKNKYANKIKKEVNKYANKIKKEVNNYSNNPDIEINNILYAFNKKQKFKRELGVAEKNKKQTWVDYKKKKTEERKPQISNLKLSRRRRKKSNTNLYLNSYIWRRFFKDNSLTLEHTTVYPYWDFRLVNKFVYNFFSYRWSQGINDTKKFKSFFSLKYINILLKLLSRDKLFFQNNWYNNVYKKTLLYLPENFKSLSFFIFNVIKDKKRLLNFNTFFLSQFFSLFWINFFFFHFNTLFFKKELLFKKYFYFYAFLNFFRTSAVYYNFFKFFSLGLNIRLLSYKKQNKGFNLFFRKSNTFKNKKLNLKTFIFKFNFLFLKVLNENLTLLNFFAKEKKHKIWLGLNILNKIYLKLFLFLDLLKRKLKTNVLNGYLFFKFFKKEITILNKNLQFFKKMVLVCLALKKKYFFLSAKQTKTIFLKKLSFGYFSKITKRVRKKVSLQLIKQKFKKKYFYNSKKKYSSLKKFHKLNKFTLMFFFLKFGTEHFIFDFNSNFDFSRFVNLVFLLKFLNTVNTKMLNLKKKNESSIIKRRVKKKNRRKIKNPVSFLSFFNFLFNSFILKRKPKFVNFGLDI
jgi:hypothetical protein